jgi:hypothetical protein
MRIIRSSIIAVIFSVGLFTAAYADWSGLNGWRPISPSESFPAGAPASALARFPHHLDLFAVRGDGRVYTSWFDDGADWSGLNGWRPISPAGSFPAGAPVSALARFPNHLDLFAVGGDGRVYTSWFDDGADWSGFNGWRPISPAGTFPAGAPVSALARFPHHLDLFAVGGDGRV